MIGQSSGADWYLEGSVDGETPPTRFRLSGLPVRVGRQPGLEVVLPVSHVSTLHAEIFESQERLWVRDLGSSNGTRLNQRPLREPAPLSDGDIVHFADMEFVLERVAASVPTTTPTGLLPYTSGQIASGPRSRARALRQLIDEERACAVFQPIVDLRSCRRSGFELLGRGAHEALPTKPGPLFEIANAAGLAAELSTLFRSVGTRVAASLDGAPRIFINTHPVEVGTRALFESLVALREQYPALLLALEVHETTVTHPKCLRELRSALVDLEIPLAFDDFGAGQARLLELAEAPPDFLKFDMCLMRDIHKAPASRQSMVEKLVNIGRDAGVLCLAEGVESEEELNACRQIGFEFAQGYLLGRPKPAEHWRDEARPGAGTSRSSRPRHVADDAPKPESTT